MAITIAAIIQKIVVFMTDNHDVSALHLKFNALQTLEIIKNQNTKWLIAGRPSSNLDLMLELFMKYPCSHGIKSKTKPSDGMIIEYSM